LQDEGVFDHVKLETGHHLAQKMIDLGLLTRTRIAASLHLTNRHHRGQVCFVEPEIEHALIVKHAAGPTDPQRLRRVTIISRLLVTVW
jgi:hypothetical protein